MGPRDFASIVVLGSALVAPAHAEATAELDRGVLVVRGDGGSDELAIAPSPTAPGSIRVEALVTQVNGAGFADFTGVKSLDVDLGAGDDLLRIGSLVAGPRLSVRGVHVADPDVADVGLLSMNVRGTVEVALGDGADRVDLTDVAITGALLVDLDPRAGATDSSNDTLGILNTQVRGGVDVFGGDGNDTFTISSVAASDGPPTKFKNATFDLAGGAGNSFLFSNTEVTGTLRVLGGAGNDTVGLIHLVANATPAPKLKAVDLELGDGANLAVVGSSTDDGTVAGKVEVASGGGDDRVLLTRVQVTGTVTGDLGGGADEFSFRDGSVKRTVRVELGAGDDQVIVDRTSFAGPFSADGGEGAGDAARLRSDPPQFRTVPVLGEFEESEGAGVKAVLRDDADEFDRLEVDLVTGGFEVFVDGVSQGTGAATLKAKGPNVTVTSTTPALRFTTKVNFPKRTGKCRVVDDTGALVVTIADTDPTF